MCRSDTLCVRNCHRGSQKSTEARLVNIRRNQTWSGIATCNSPQRVEISIALVHKCTAFIGDNDTTASNYVRTVCAPNQYRLIIRPADSQHNYYWRCLIWQNHRHHVITIGRPFCSQHTSVSAKQAANILMYLVCEPENYESRRLQRLSDTPILNDTFGFHFSRMWTM